MSVPPAFNCHQSPHLQTDPCPERRSIIPVAPSPLSSFARREPWGYESPSGEYYGRICSVIGLYDFFSSDPDRLSFRKHDILEIVRQDESGWWGAVRSDGSEIGWIPAKFVRALSDDAAYTVHDIREETRIPGFAAESESVGSALPLSRRIVGTLSSSTGVPGHEASATTQVSSQPSRWSDPSIITEPPRDPTTPDHLRNSPSPNSEPHDEIEDPLTATVSPSIVSPVSQGPKHLRLDKSLPASPDGTTAPSSASAVPKISAHRRNSSDSAIDLPDSPSSDQLSSLINSLDIPPSPLPYPFPPNARPRPGKVLQLTGDDSAEAFHNAKQAQANLPWSLPDNPSGAQTSDQFSSLVSFLDPLSPLPYPFPTNARSRPGKVLQLTGDGTAQAFHDAKQAQANIPWFLSDNPSGAQTSDQFSYLVSSLDPPSPLPYPFPPDARPRPGKVLQLTGDDSAQAFHNAKQAQANLPWFLKHRHGEEEIKLDFDGTVKAGTLPALVEHLVVDALRASQQEIFRRAFLVTFRTFATAIEVFDLLAAQYELDAPPNLSKEEFEQWKREKMRPTQKRVLTVLTMWLEEYDLLNQDPEVAPKLQDFLRLIVTPPPLALTAKHMLKSLERLTFAEPSAPEAIVLPTRKWKKMRKGEGLELVRMDPLEMAQHLSLRESDLYREIRPQECFLWPTVKEGDDVKNLHSFCATHDKLADWVKCSILEVAALGKRANVVDFWIRVAEKCKSLNNFSSMSSIVAALSSVLISRLHFTWVNSSREHALDPLRKIIHPASNYGYYRSILEAVDGPCVPFIGPFLKNVIYAQEQHADTVFVQSTTNPDKHFTLIHFVKRQKWYDVTLQMLRFQAKPYLISEIPEMTSFITGQIDRAATMGERWYWQRSDELQHAELVHADIRRGLEAAGF